MIWTNDEGLTLVELIIVLVILILLSMLFLKNLSSFNRENQLEDDCKKIHAFLQQMRMEAFSEKQTLNIVLRDSGKKLCETISNHCIELKNQFGSTGNFTVTTRGTFSSGNIHVEQLNGSPTYSCVAISPTRIRLGAWDGNSTCNAK